MSRFQARSRWLLAGLVLVIGLGSGFWLGSTQLWGQGIEDDTLTPDQRAQLYLGLERDVAELERHGRVLKTVVKLVSPTVVHIEARKADGSSRTYGRRQSVEEAGSGVIVQIGEKQFVLTNRHVVKDALLSDISINLADGRVLNPTDLRHDPDTDVAIMAVSAPRLIAAKIGNSDTVDIGDFVLAVGSPFGLSRSVTYGIISAKGRRDLELGDDGVRFQDFMQTDAAINPGNSGGPLINLRGEVIGINTAIASNSGGNEGIGFSIPINMVTFIARQLVDRGSVQRAFLGVHLDTKFGPTMAAKFGLPRVQGARITMITPDSPAALAKLRVDDVIVQFDGIKVENDAHLINLVSLTEVGREVALLVLRDHNVIKMSVRVGDRSQFEPRAQIDSPLQSESSPELSLSDDLETWDVDALGVSVVSLEPTIAAQLRVSSKTGLLITRIVPNGPAAGQVKRGDVIDRINTHPIQSIDDLEEAMSSADLASGLRLHVQPATGGSKQPRTVIVQPMLHTAG
jgi:serine protease Do